MGDNNTQRPRQRIPLKEKDETWKNNSYDYYSSMCLPAIDRGKAIQNYRIANGQLDESEYTFVTNPLNATKPNLMGYPARLKNFDIIGSNLNTVMGDYIQRFIPPVVVVRNSNYDNFQLEQLKNEAVKLMQKHFINEAVGAGVPLEKEQITASLDEIKRKIKTLPNQLGIDAQDALDYIIDYAEMLRKLKQCFYDYMVTARTFTWKDVHNDDVEYYSISAINMSYFCSPQIDFVENGDAVKCSYTFSINDIYDRFQDLDDFKDNKELQAYLDQANVATETIRTDFYYATDAVAMQKQMWKNVMGHYPSEYNKQGIQVEHLQWRGFRKMYCVKFIDVLGNQQEVEYGEDYIPAPGEDYEIVWRDQLWEGYKINDKYRIGIKPVQYQQALRPTFNYNGRNTFVRYGDPSSLVDKGAAFQKKYNVIHYKLEESLLKNLDRLVVFPLSLVPDKEGYDENTVMYYARALSFLFVDDTKPGFANAINGLKSVDMSLNQYIMQMYGILNSIKEEWDAVCGMSPQRKSEISGSAGKGTTDLAIQRSYIISEAMYTEFDEFSQREYTGVLELSKFAFANGKRAAFVRRNGEVAHLNISDVVAYTNAEMNVFIKNTSKEAKRLSELKAVAQALAQNQTKPSVIAKIIGTDNYQEIVSVLDDMEQEMLQRGQQQQQQEQQLIQQQEKDQQEQFLDELDFKYYKVDNDNLAKERVAIITSLKANLDAIKPIIDDPSAMKEKTEMQSLYNDRRAKIEDNFKALKDIDLKQEELRLKDKEIRSKERMNTANNKVAMKNKVVGEK